MIERIPSIARAFAFGCVVLAAWEVTALSHSGFIPSPLQVLRTAVDEAQHGRLIADMAATSARALTSFVIAMVGGTALGYVCGRFRPFDKWIQPGLSFFLNAPAIVVMMICYIALGLNDAALLVAVAVTKVPNVAVNVREGVLRLDRELDQLAIAFELPASRRLRRIVAPQIAPFFIGSARTSLALVWKLVLVAELMGRPNGVGFALETYFQLFDLRKLLAYCLCFMAWSMSLEGLILASLSLLEQRHSCSYRSKKRASAPRTAIDARS